jgi:hypothetical protein
MQKATAMSAGKPVGPVCAVKLKLVAPKAPSTRVVATRAMSKRLKAFWQAQRDLFEGILT